MAKPRGRARSRSRGRRPGFRSPRPRLLVLCEGARTEPNYFGALRQELGLSGVKVDGPATLKEMPEKVRKSWKDDFDEVWCVFDVDERDEEVRRLRTELNRLRRKTKKGVHAAVSAPCFEYWLLLHFAFTTKTFYGMEGGRSACQQVIQRLQVHLPGYKKNDAAVYDRCRAQLAKALQRARRLDPEQPNPTTEVGKLVERLQGLRSSLT